MNLLRTNKNILLVIFSLVLLSGCGSKKTIETGTGSLAKKSNENVIKDVLKNEFDYKTISAKGSIELKMGSSKKTTAVYKIIKDSVLQVSVRIPILGSEAMRATITTDSIFIVDRLNRKYVAERFKDSKLASQFDFNFYNLQSLLTNKIFVPGSRDVQKQNYDKFKIAVANENYLLQAKDKGNLSYTFSVDASDHLISTLIYNDKQEVTLQWTYADFIQDKTLVYPTRIDASADIAKKRFELGISYNKLDIDQPVNIDYSVSSRYQKVDFEDLIGAYIKKK